MFILNEIPHAVMTPTAGDVRVGQLAYNVGNDCWYRYVYNAGAAAGVKGEWAGQFTTGAVKGYVSRTIATTVVDTQAAASALIVPTGIFLNALPTTYYGWVFCGGWAIDESGVGLLKTGGGIVAGDPLSPDDGTAYITQLMAAVDAHCKVGFAPGADVGTVLAAQITLI